jgi:magnesium and cobalt transporter
MVYCNPTMTNTNNAPMPQNPSALVKTDDEDGPSSAAVPAPAAEKHGFLDKIKQVFSPPSKNDSEALREAIEEYIEEQPQAADTDPVSVQERMLFSNILALRDITVYDVMVPRADIAALEVDCSKEQLFAFLATNNYSRFPVFKNTMDDILGSVHLKDIMAVLAQGQKIKLKTMLTDVPIVSPAMPIMDLLLVMRKTSRHMALVVDEYGGIDGLITIGDVIGTIIGEIDDEHDKDDVQLVTNPDGSILADARLDIEEFEEKYGLILTEEEREESDTLGGLVFAMAGRVPSRGEVLTHSSGMIFEVLEADPRKISRLKIRNIPRAPDTL